MFTNPLEEVDLDEKRAILLDLFNAMPIQGNVKLLSSKMNEEIGFFGGKKTKTYFKLYKC